MALKDSPTAKVGIALLIIGAALLVLVPIGGIFYAHRATTSAAPEHKAETLARGIKIAMVGPLVGIGVMAVGAIVTIAGTRRSSR